VAAGGAGTAGPCANEGAATQSAATKRHPVEVTLNECNTTTSSSSWTGTRNDLRARRPAPGGELQKGIRGGGRGTAGRRKQPARRRQRGGNLAGTARACQVHLPETGLDAGVVGGGT